MYIHATIKAHISKVGIVFPFPPACLVLRFSRISTSFCCHHHYHFFPNDKAPLIALKLKCILVFPIKKTNSRAFSWNIRREDDTILYPVLFWRRKQNWVCVCLHTVVTKALLDTKYCKRGANNFTYITCSLLVTVKAEKHRHHHQFIIITRVT